MDAISTDEPLRYGIIGSGMMGGEHLLDLAHLPDAVAVAIADPHEPSLEWGVACAGHDLATYRDHRALLERDDLDVVVVATPNHTHRSVLDDLWDTDLAILVEKPLCTTVADCLEVQRRAAGRDAMVWVGLEYRFMPSVRTLLDQVAGGGCGTTRMVSIREHRFPFLQKVGDWNRFTANTGGTLVEKCCHFFDLMRLVAEADPVRVYASGGQDVNHLDERYDGRVPDILDNAFVIVDFANGVRGALDLSMFAEGGRFEQELCVVGDRGKVEATVPGDRVWFGPRDGSGPVEVPAPQDPDVPYPELHQGSSFLEHRAMVRALREGRPAEVTVEDGLWSVAMGEAAHRSIDEGRPVLLAELGLPELAQ